MVFDGCRFIYFWVEVETILVDFFFGLRSFWFRVKRASPRMLPEPLISAGWLPLLDLPWRYYILIVRTFKTAWISQLNCYWNQGCKCLKSQSVKYFERSGHSNSYSTKSLCWYFRSTSLGNEGIRDLNPLETRSNFSQTDCRLHVGTNV